MAPFFRFTFFLLVYLALPLTATAQVVNIPDLNLRAAIENRPRQSSRCPNHRQMKWQLCPVLKHQHQETGYQQPNWT